MLWAENPVAPSNQMPRAPKTSQLACLQLFFLFLFKPPTLIWPLPAKALPPPSALDAIPVLSVLFYSATTPCPTQNIRPLKTKTWPSLPFPTRLTEPTTHVRKIPQNSITIWGDIGTCYHLLNIPQVPITMLQP